jgi:hypothetical protein
VPRRRAEERGRAGIGLGRVGDVSATRFG